MDWFDRIIQIAIAGVVCCALYEIYEIIVGFNHLLKVM